VVQSNQSTEEQAAPGASAAPLAALEARLGYRFHDPALLRVALTHRSFAYESGDPREEHNERLEFLGDAVLGFLAADLAYTHAPAATEGQLTAARAALIRAQTLARLALGLGLDAHLRVGRGHAGVAMSERIWASTFEAVVGAIYRDGGLAAASAFVVPLLADELERALATEDLKDAKSVLQDRAQAQLGITPAYRTVTAEGPAHAPRFVVEVLIGERVAGTGAGANKRQAEQAAAGRALEDPGWAAPRDA
jgi:ribonuclease-3